MLFELNVKKKTEQIKGYGFWIGIFMTCMC